MRYLFITITLLLLSHPHLRAQQLTTQAPPAQALQEVLPDAPDYPTARPLIPPLTAGSPVIESASQAYAAGVYTLDGAVVITYKERRIQADHIVYDSNSGDVTATGHLLLTGGTNDERIAASHGTLNLNTSTGRFFDVTGSVGMRPVAPGSRRMIYTSGNPFLFSGSLVVKTGPQNYDVYHGSVTSCQLPRPDWMLTSDHFVIDEKTASAHNSVFRLLNVPLLFLPYVTHPTDSDDRQSGILIPTIGQSSTKGLILGEQVYLVLNRSADLTLGAEYYSSIGFAQNANFRYKGPGLDFLTFHYNGVLDRRVGTANQGGEDVLLSARHDFTPNTRAATNVDYLSSYIFREAFTDNFNQAVNSDIISTAYVTREHNGTETAGLFDRYQGIKLIAQGTTPQQQVRIFHAPTLSYATTDHALGDSNLPLLRRLEFSLESDASGLKRTQPNFVTGGIIERFDFHPRAAFPIALGEWRFTPSIAARETIYSRSRAPTAAGQPPQQSPSAILRSDFEFAFDIRPPVLTRTFKPVRFTRLLGDEIRHTVEPELTYRLTDGVDNFARLLRFDATDVVSNTNEAEYGVTQRLFRRVHHPGACDAAAVAQQPGLNAESSESPFSRPDAVTASSEGPTTQNGGQAANPTGGLGPEVSQPGAETGPGSPDKPCGTEELISWRLTQRYFFDQTFGGAVVNGRRNIFQTTLDLSGVAFITAPRQLSPLISRLRVRTSAHTDIEWDADLDTSTLKFNSSNVFVDYHHDDAFAALSYARLDAPGRFYTESPDPAAGSTVPTGVSSSISDFNQLRLLVGYGNPTRPGLSIAANTGLDLKSLYGTTSTTTTPPTPLAPLGTTSTTTIYPALLQYAAVQAAYNWNCCGLAVEYRKFELGSVRNEGSYRFNFTLANIGAAGNLRRTERLF